LSAIFTIKSSFSGNTMSVLDAVLQDSAIEKHVLKKRPCDYGPGGEPGGTCTRNIIGKIRSN